MDRNVGESQSLPRFCVCHDETGIIVTQHTSKQRQQLPKHIITSSTMVPWRCRRAAAVGCSPNGYLSSRGGCQNRRHSLVHCDHSGSTSSRFDSPPPHPPPAAAPPPPRPTPAHAHIHIVMIRTDAATPLRLRFPYVSTQIICGAHHDPLRMRLPARAASARAGRRPSAPAATMTHY
jgi:hypothetical protein